MSAFVFIILALGYLHASEGKEQLSLTDFLLDFLLSLWVPSNYVPSKVVQSIPDPVVREQMISVEKSRSALDNYIQHLLRYASESTGTDRSQAALINDLGPDSSQSYSNNLPLACIPQGYGCEYGGSSPSQLYPNPEALPAQPIPYHPTIMAASPSQTGYSRPGPIPNQGMLYPQNMQPAHFHENQYIPAHAHQPQNYEPMHPHDHHQNEFWPTQGNDDSLSDWSPENIPDSIASLFPDIIGTSSNILSELMSDNDDKADCDPALDPLIYCTPTEASQPFFYGGVKRNIANYDGNRKSLISGLRGKRYPGWNSKRMANLAEKILYLARDKYNMKKSMTLPRVLGTAVPNTEIFGEIDANTIPWTRSINDYDEKRKRDDSGAGVSAKTVQTRIFEDWYLPNFLDDVLKHRHVQKIEAVPSGTIPNFASQYNNDYSDSFVAKRMIGRHLIPRGLKQYVNASPKDKTPSSSLAAPNPTASSTVTVENIESNSEPLLKRSVVTTKQPTEEKVTEKPAV